MQEVDALIMKAKEDWEEHLHSWEEQLKSSVFPSLGVPAEQCQALISWAEKHGIETSVPQQSQTDNPKKKSHGKQGTDLGARQQEKKGVSGKRVGSSKSQESVVEQGSLSTCPLPSIR